MDYKSRILIVDDQALMRDHMQRLLGREGYQLAYATNGREALELVAAFSPDLLLLDVRMPEMDGFEVCRRLRERPETADLPIIMVTAFDDREARLRGLDAGADDFIPKPYDSIELRARVRTITRLNRYRRLLSERTKFQLIAERSESGYLFVNSAGQIVFANPQARLYLGLSIDMRVGIERPFLQLAASKYQQESFQAWANWPESPPGDMPRYLVRPETTTMPVLWLAVETMDYLLSETQMVWVIHLRDVTNQMTAQYDSWKFQRAVHHKMRTPLIGMYTGVQFLSEYMSSLSQEDAQELVDTALDHGNRLRQAIEDVLRYVDSPNLAMVGGGFSFADLPSLVETITTTLGIRAVQWRGLEQVTAVAGCLGERPLELILWELLENAKKFHPQHDPTVTIRLSLTEQGQIRLQIHDDGVTLAPEQIERAWSPYYQAEKNFTGEVKGMGLGLPTVAMVMWSVGGACRIYNLEGQGIGVALIIPPLAVSEIIG